MVQNGVQWFSDLGEHPFEMTSTAQTGWNATYTPVDWQSVPVSGTPGGTLPLSVIVKNTGGGTWNANDMILCGRFIDSSGNWVNSGVGFENAVITTSVSPNTNAPTVNMTMHLPTLPGAYTLKLDLWNSATNKWLSSEGVASQDLPIMIGAYGVLPGASYAKLSDSAQLNLISGNLILSATDFKSSGRGPPIDITRTLNTLSGSTGAFGPGWSSILDSKLTVNGDNSVTYTAPDGGAYTFKPNGAVTSVNITGHGSGYSTPATVTVSDPAGGGTTATAAATMANGSVSVVTVLGSGSGYSSAPTVTISAPGAGGTTATATAEVSYTTYAYVHPRGLYMTLTRNSDGSFDLTNKDNTLTYKFGAPSGGVSLLSQITDNNYDANLNPGVRFNYSANGKVSSIDEASRDALRSVQTGYVGSGNGAGKVSYIRVPSSAQRGYSFWVYSYDTNNRLETVTFDPASDPVAVDPNGTINPAANSNPLGLTTTYRTLRDNPSS